MPLADRANNNHDKDDGGHGPCNRVIFARRQFRLPKYVGFGLSDQSDQRESVDNLIGEEAIDSFKLRFGIVKTPITSFRMFAIKRKQLRVAGRLTDEVARFRIATAACGNDSIETDERNHSS